MSFMWKFYTSALNRSEAKKRKAKQHESEKVFMTSLRQVKETGEYRGGKEESCSEEESNQVFRNYNLRIKVMKNYNYLL